MNITVHPKLILIQAIVIIARYLQSRLQLNSHLETSRGWVDALSG
jgi:hypothetical protein